MRYSILGILLGLVGCGSPMGEVSGVIYHSDKPVAEGRIEFVPVDGKSATAAAKIVEGRYWVEVPPGEKIVRLYAFEETSRHVPRGYSFEVVNKKQILPEELNLRSERRVVIRRGKQNWNLGKP
ncbi:MAG: hypothetical protein Q4D62_12690 [Planctomycetia bacterium]|nr:hypothetical protein [Planctomycetia bacterium]